MSLSVGIVGLPNVGKSTLFNALLKKRVALSANYPFATVEPNVGVVAVPDGRLEKLADLVALEEGMIAKDLLDGSRIKSGMTVEAGKYLPPIIPAVVEFVDIAGLVKGASTGAGLGNQFLSHIREVDAIIHVLRDFADPNIIREGSVAPSDDKVVVETELALADLQVIEKIQSSKFKVQNDNSKFKISAVSKINECLEKGQMAINAILSDDEKMAVSDLNLLTMKPVLYIYNVAEGEYELRIKNQESSDKELVISAKLEEEMADFSEEERKGYLQELGIEETGLERLIRKAYALLGLISFLTAGKKEIRAWTIKKGTKAPQAAGVIHTDFIGKFIRAEAIAYEKLIEAGSYGAAKQKGWVRTEGKDYIVEDGDVIEFLIGS